MSNYRIAASATFTISFLQRLIVQIKTNRKPNNWCISLLSSEVFKSHN
ncbi:hypothetical protein AOR13_2108 [Alteromonas stellipolaris LMG 21856]|nr:hypothetical protein AOR13_2108 [Alteromonas stellipolaris LMG 21856]